MSKSEKTSATVAAKASAVLRNPASTKTEKSVAASALSQTGTRKETSAKVATAAAKTLDSGRSSATSKSIAASVLTQKPRRGG